MIKRQIAGINSVITALEKNVSFVELCIDKKKQSPRIQRLIQLAETQNIPVTYTDKLQLDLLVPGIKHQGVVATIEVQDNQQTLYDLIAQVTNPLVLMLDGIQDPHNLGACLRSAAAANVDAVILPKNQSAQLSPTVSKVACGGAETVPLFYETNLTRTLSQLKSHGLWSMALSSHAQQSIYETDLRAGVVLIMGSEGKGVSSNLSKHVDFHAAIPMPGEMESLNVSVATGITLFEALRQRLS